MIEVPYRFLTIGVNYEDRRRQQFGRCEGLDALPSGSIGELSEALELRALRKAAVFINVLHVVPALLNLGRCATQRCQQFYQRGLAMQQIFSARRRKPRRS